VPIALAATATIETFLLGTLLLLKLRRLAPLEFGAGDDTPVGEEQGTGR